MVGAGPHGLAAAAHLRSAGVATEIFGQPMEFWREQMPRGMLLRSALRACNIASPHRSHTLERWASSRNRELAFPLALEDFVEYASWYEAELVPEVDRRRVERVQRSGGGFELVLSDASTVRVARVAVAAGIGRFGRIPAPFQELPSALVSHSSQHTDLAVFRGRRVAVLGSGQSALESAALLHESGAEVEVVYRADAIWWLLGPPPKSRLPRPHWPQAPTDLARPKASWLVAAPDIYRRLPTDLQLRLNKHVGPAGGHWLKPRMNGIPMTSRATIARAEQLGEQLRLHLSDRTERTVDHLLLGTGYEINIRGYEFLDSELATSVRSVDGYPVLGPGLESSVAGLHFLGAPAAYTFGPAMRFVTGTWYTARALTTQVRGRRQPPLRWSF